jgi:hypothetical protein
MNGVSVGDASGARFQFGSGEPPKVDIVKRGPLSVMLRYAGRLTLGGTYQAPVVVTLEMPNSKSWFRMTATVEDPERRIRDITFDSTFGYGDFPWLWDFGTDSGTYGAIRTAADAVVLTQVVGAKGTSRWQVENSVKGELRPYEVSTGRPAAVMAGWGHLLDARSATAFGIERFAERIGTYTISLRGDGRAVFRFASAEPSLRHELTVFHHFVPTPVPIGAATSPASMLRPLAVEVK